MPEGVQQEQSKGWVLQVVTTALLFCLIMGMAGSVDVRTLRAQFRNPRGIVCGMLCQFVVMPFVCFLLVLTIQPSHHVALTMMILCSSPGGAYSNWWCSLFNADLALSVAMTAVSTVMSGGMLPLNLTLYVALLKGNMPVPWVALFQGVGTVSAAILSGIAVSTRWPHLMRCMTRVGNVCGILMLSLMVFLAVIRKPKGSQDSGPPPAVSKTAEDPMFYVAVCSPFFVSMLLSLLISSIPSLGLSKPQRVAITVEVCYQNVGIASAVAISAFSNEPEKLADAAKVPVIYGALEAGVLALFLVGAWKAGWTYAPPQEEFCQALRGDHQPRPDDSDGAGNDIMEDQQVVEVELEEGRLPSSVCTSTAQGIVEEGKEDDSQELRE